MRFNIRNKLLVAFSAVLAMLVAAGGLGIYELGQSNRRMTEFVTGSFQRVNELAALNDEVAQSGRLITNIILSNDDATMASMRASYEAATTDYARQLTAYAALLPRDRVGEVDGIAAAAKAIDEVGRQAMDLAQRNDVVKATALSRGQGSAMGNRLAVSLASLRDELVWLDGPEQAQAVSSQLGADVPTVWRMVMTSLAETDAGELGRLAEEVRHETAAIDDKLAVIETSLALAKLDVPAFPRVKRLWSDFKPATGQLLDFGTTNATFRAAELQRSKIGPAFDVLTAKLAAVTAREKAFAEQSAADTAASYALTRNTLIALVAGAIGISIVAAMLLLRSVGHPIVQMTTVMTQLAAGRHDVEVPAKDRRDEIGAMAAAVQEFKEAGLAKRRLEAEAVENRAHAEEDRSRTEAERARVAAEQATVVTALAHGLGVLAEGDLVFRLDAAFAREYEQLRADFNAAMDKLQGTMTTITVNTAAIRSGSTEISVAADDLAKRTEQQAASLEQTAAALDEITATVKKTAAGARHARDVVTTTKDSAERSSTVVGRAIDAMTSIERSSQEVNQIVGVIDEIAFQTNLLALNAGVEAARAGEAGRGFAVVASEVRALAQRSAEAAKEIKALIFTSAGQVAEGVGLVGETGVALRSIAEHVTEVHAIVSEISASAQEQATGLEQVNTAVNQMDQVTQQNAAMVEESTAASHSLAGETETLSRMVSQFSIGPSSGLDLRRDVSSNVARSTPIGRATRSAPARSRSALAVAPAPELGVEAWEEF